MPKNEEAQEHKGLNLITKEVEVLSAQWEMSAERQSGYYSDSEEEDAPQHPNVFNYTKRKEKRKKIVNNYALQPEEVLPEQLRKDAQTIHDIIPQTSESYGATTILCAALRNRQGRIKKFAFSNANGVLLKNLRKKAHQLNYHVVRAQQAHAEGQCLQFLQERPQGYTHLMSMGCDKEHCQECDWAMEKVFGKGYLEVSSNQASTQRFKKWYISPALESVIEQAHTPFSQDQEREKRHRNKSWPQYMKDMELYERKRKPKPTPKVKKSKTVPPQTLAQTIEEPKKKKPAPAKKSKTVPAQTLAQPIEEPKKKKPASRAKKSKTVPPQSLAQLIEEPKKKKPAPRPKKSKTVPPQSLAPPIEEPKKKKPAPRPKKSKTVPPQTLAQTIEEPKKKKPAPRPKKSKTVPPQSLAQTIEEPKKKKPAPRPKKSKTVPPQSLAQLIEEPKKKKPAPRPKKSKTVPAQSPGQADKEPGSISTSKE